MRNQHNFIRLRHTLSILSLCFLFTSFGFHLFGQELTYCKRSEIVGFEIEKKRAEKLFRKGSTSNLSEIEVFVTIKNGHFYFHSNYKKLGSDYPIKLSYEKDRFESNWYDAKRMIEFIVNPSNESMYEYSGFMPQAEIYERFPLLEKYNDNVTIYLDHALINNDIISSLDLGDAKNVYFVDEKRNEYRTKSFINFSTGEPNRAIEVEKNLYFRPYSNFLNSYKKLERRNMRKNEVELVSLIINSTTDAEITKEFKGNGSLFDFKNEQDLENYFSKRKGKTIFVLGHIEQNEFVTYDPAGKRIFDIPLQKIIEFGDKYNNNVIPYGCNSARYDNSGLSLGTISKIESKDAVINLSTAIKNRNFKEFLEDLANDQSVILVEDDPFKYDIYSKVRKIQILKKSAVGTGGFELIATLYYLEEEDDNRMLRNIIIVLSLVFLPALLLIRKLQFDVKKKTNNGTNKN